MSVCVFKLICNLCKEHRALESSCVTASFPFLSSLLLFLFSIPFPYWAITHTAGCAAASATPATNRCTGISRRTTPRAVFTVPPPAFCSSPTFSPPFVTLAHQKSGLRMTRLDCGEMANTPRQLEGVMVRTSKEMCRLIWRPVYVDSCAGLQVWTEPQTVETFRDSMNTFEAELIKGRGKSICSGTAAANVACRLM